jgi:hypothetical protein
MFYELCQIKVFDLGVSEALALPLLTTWVSKYYRETIRSREYKCKF